MLKGSSTYQVALRGYQTEIIEVKAKSIDEAMEKALEGNGKLIECRDGDQEIDKVYLIKTNKAYTVKG